MRALEERVRGLVRELERGRGELEGLVKDGRGVKKGIEGLEKGKSFLLGSVLLSFADHSVGFVGPLFNPHWTGVGVLARHARLKIPQEALARRKSTVG